MLNETCYFEEPFDFMIIHYIALTLSIIVYAIGFFVLIFKTPKHFSKYRNLLMAHIFSGFLLDIVMGVLWKVTIVLPVPVMCSNTFASEYAPNVFQLLPACFAYTGASAISLFVHRMEAVIVHRSEQSTLRKVTKYLKYAFYMSIVFVLILTILIYPDLKNQRDYKIQMEKRFGTFKPYMWCDNCFFMNFSSKIFYVFFIVAGIAVVLGGTTGGIAFHVTVEALKSVSLRLTAKTKATHRNYLMSLSLAAGVHVVCIVLPLLGVLSAINVMISLSNFRYFPFILTLIIQEHGAASTVIMFMTNNLLRGAVKKLFKCENGTVTADNSTANRSTVVV
ncbi:Serpentine Receptor, class H [Caenorhabditis elegans]|uniref:Serpentine Receptor, class H n=1 Tax=Caenorhabditis elegans TaxID=6239 RepID=Q9TXK6_CAEEL|nr:Serpentine Receptor, class H [Caenorhabditis elegans]CCD72637.1 Serpentine Receptor, class H [Caenorhabditis elegans]|eukprot:NP_503481.1 Serpentine Receptor, class H [Caenorhabditis elegans]